MSKELIDISKENISEIVKVIKNIMAFCYFENNTFAMFNDKPAFVYYDEKPHSLNLEGYVNFELVEFYSKRSVFIYLYGSNSSKISDGFKITDAFKIIDLFKQYFYNENRKIANYEYISSKQASLEFAEIVYRFGKLSNILEYEKNNFELPFGTVELILTGVNSGDEKDSHLKNNEGAYFDVYGNEIIFLFPIHYHYTYNVISNNVKELLKLDEEKLLDLLSINRTSIEISCKMWDMNRVIPQDGYIGSFTVQRPKYKSFNIKYVGVRNKSDLTLNEDEVLIDLFLPCGKNLDLDNLFEINAVGKINKKHLIKLEL